MDMPMTTESDSVVRNLSLSDLRCRNESCVAFLDAENASQGATPWASLFRYGHWTTWYYLAIISVFTIIHILRKVKDYRSQSIQTSTTRTEINNKTAIWQKLRGLVRYFSYRQISIRPFKRTHSLVPANGVLTILITTILFLVLLTFASRPYYRPHMAFGAPPIAIRTGLMAFACTPILIALAGKVNIISLLTGISHEKLNVFHRWVAWMTFVLSLIHAVPFFLQSYWDGPFYGVSKADNLKAQFYVGGWYGGGNQFTGVPPFVILLLLCVLSIRPVRHRFHATFYLGHVLLAILYLPFMFWHSWNLMDSWVYLWATVALWLASWTARLFWKMQPMSLKHEWFVGCPTNITHLPGDMTKIEILAPPSFTYERGQHCLIRVPEVGKRGNHPFSIVSVHDSDNQPTKSDKIRNRLSGLVEKNTSQNVSFDKHHKVVLYARTYSGFTQALSSHFHSQQPTDTLNTSSTLLDGPYGGICRPIERYYDTLILAAGGSGITACLPWLLSLTTEALSSYDLGILRRVVLIWTIKKADHVLWIDGYLRNSVERNQDNANGLHLQIRFNVTMDDDLFLDDQYSLESLSNHQSKSEIGLAIESPGPLELRQTSSNKMANLGQVAKGRPVLKDVLAREIVENKTLVISCGPESFLTDLINACGGLQRKVLTNEISELALHTERFGW